MEAASVFAHPSAVAVEDVEAVRSLVIGTGTIPVLVLSLATTPSAHLFQATNDGLSNSPSAD